MLDENSQVVTTASLGVRCSDVIEGSESSNDFIIKLVHKSTKLVGADEH